MRGLGGCRCRGPGGAGPSVRRGLLGKRFMSRISETHHVGQMCGEPPVTAPSCPLSSLENPKFPGILARLEESPVCQRLPLTSFLILPFQRVTRLKMLVEVAHFRKGGEGEVGLPPVVMFSLLYRVCLPFYYHILIMHNRVHCDISIHTYVIPNSLFPCVPSHWPPSSSWVTPPSTLMSVFCVTQ